MGPRSRNAGHDLRKPRLIVYYSGVTLTTLHWNAAAIRSPILDFKPHRILEGLARAGSHADLNDDTSAPKFTIMVKGLPKVIQ